MRCEECKLTVSEEDTSCPFCGLQFDCAEHSDVLKKINAIAGFDVTCRKKWRAIFLLLALVFIVWIFPNETETNDNKNERKQNQNKTINETTLNETTKQNETERKVMDT